MKKELNQSIVAAVIAAIVVGIILIAYNMLTAGPVSKEIIESGVLSFKDYDFFYYDGEGWHVSYYPLNALGEGIPATIRVYNVKDDITDDVNDEQEITDIPVSQCWDGCEYQKFVIDLEKIGKDYVFYSVKLK